MPRGAEHRSRMVSQKPETGLTCAILPASSLTTSSSCFAVHRNVKRSRGGLVFKAHRWLYHSTLGSRVIKNNKKKVSQKPETVSPRAIVPASSLTTSSSCFVVWGAKCRFRGWGARCRFGVQGVGFGASREKVSVSGLAAKNRFREVR